MKKKWKNIEVRFHDLTSILSDNFDEYNDEIARTVDFFHDLRNKLYHETGGIEVNKADVALYIKTVIRLFKTLLSVDIIFSVLKT